MKKYLLFLLLLWTSIARAQQVVGSLLFVTSASPPSVPTAGITEYVDSSARESWMQTTGFSYTFDATGLTASRVYTLPATAGTLALTSQIPSLPVSGANGGTGVSNSGSTITIGGNVAFSGAYTFTGTLTAATGVTFPTSGTLATTAQLPSLPAGTGLMYSTSGVYSTLSVTGSGNALTALNAITGATTSDVTITAGAGANNSINLYLPGTGPVRVGASGGTYATSGAIAISSGTTNAQAINFGTDCSIYRTSSNQITVNLISGGQFVVANGNVVVGSGQDFRLDGNNRMYVATGQVFLEAGGNTFIKGLTSTTTIYSNGVQSALFDASQNTTLAGNITTAAGSTAAAAAWNLGGIRTGTALAPSTTTGVQVSIGGTLLTLAVLLTNP